MTNEMIFSHLLLFLRISLLLMLQPKIACMVPPDYCFYELNKSDCNVKPTPVFYYYKPGSRCEMDIWRGCPTFNKFENEYECSNTCIYRFKLDSSIGIYANWDDEIKRLPTDDVDKLNQILILVLNKTSIPSTLAPIKTTSAAHTPLPPLETTLPDIIKHTTPEVTVTTDNNELNSIPGTTLNIVATTPMATATTLATVDAHAVVTENLTLTTTSVDTKDNEINTENINTTDSVTTENIITTGSEIITPDTTDNIITTESVSIVDNVVVSTESATETTIVTTTVTTSKGDPEEVIVMKK